MKMPRPQILLKSRSLERQCLAIQFSESCRYWRLEAGSWTRIDKPDTNDRIWRICDFDMVTPHSGRKKKSLLRYGREILKERAAMMKVGRWVAFTREDGVDVGGFKSRPFALAFRGKLEDVPTPAILQVSVPGDYSALAIYYRDGTVSGWTLTSQEDIEVTGQRLAQQSGVADASLHELPAAEQILDEAPETRAFPLEPEWGSIPISYYRMAVLLSSVVVCGSGIAHWGFRHEAWKHAHKQDQAAQMRLSQARQQIRKWDIRHADALARRGGINPMTLIGAAGKVYVPGAHVSLVKGGKQLRVILPTVSLSPIAHGEWTLPSMIHQRLIKPAPKGWQIKGLYRDGNGKYSVVYVAKGGAQ